MTDRTITDHISTITDALATVCVGTPPLPDAGLDAMWAGAAAWVFIVGLVLACLAKPRGGHVSSGRAVHDLTPPPNLLPPGSKGDRSQMRKMTKFEQDIRDAIHDDNDWPGILTRLVDPDDIEDRMARAVLATDEMRAIRTALRDMATSLACECNDDVNHGASVKGGTRGWLTFHLPDGMDHVIDWVMGEEVPRG